MVTPPKPTKNEIHLSLSQGEPTALVLLDLFVAFNTIDYTTLLNCLKSWFGLCGMALSELRELLFGVQQGSVLGHLLCSLYTTPLCKVIGMHPDIKCHF